MCDKWHELINQHRMLIQTLRLYPGLDKTKIAEKIGVSSPTLYKALDELKNNNVIYEGTKINPFFGSFVGISVGTTYCKFILLHFDFTRYNAEEFMPFVTTIKNFLVSTEITEIKVDSEQNYFYIQTPESFSVLKQFLNIVFHCLKLFIEAGKFQILSIGISSTGTIDTINEHDQKIIQSHNMPYLDSRRINDLCYDDKIEFFDANNISLFLVQNSTAAVIAEKYQLYDYRDSPKHEKIQCCKNVAALYLDYGVGAGFILNNKLFTGTNGYAGEVGHLEIPVSFSEKFEEAKKVLNSSGSNMKSTCSCGSKYCIDHFIRSLTFSNTEKDFRYMTSYDIANYLSRFSKEASYLGFLLGYIINMLASALNVDLVILTGKLYRSMGVISQYIEEKNDENTLIFNRSDCATYASNIGTLSPAIGAAIYSYHKKCNIDIEWN